MLPSSKSSFGATDDDGLYSAEDYETIQPETYDSDFRPSPNLSSLSVRCKRQEYGAEYASNERRDSAAFTVESLTRGLGNLDLRKPSRDKQYEEGSTIHWMKSAGSSVRHVFTARRLHVNIDSEGFL